jgi:hypothetical protein
VDRIFDNPYRIIGLYAGVTERELQRQRSMINAYLSAGKELIFDCDFPFLPDTERNTDTIETAFSSIQLNQKKLMHSLFWFTKGTHIDEPALTNLKEGDVDKAIEIWSKVTSNPDNIKNYYLSYNNYSTLQIALASIEGKDIKAISAAFKTKLKIIESDLFTNFVKQVTDETYNPDKHDVIKQYADEVIFFIQSAKTTFTKASKSILAEIDEIFSLSDEDTRQYVRQKLVSMPLNSIEQEIKSTKAERKSKPQDGLQLGLNLIKRTENDWQILKRDFKDEYSFEQISEKIAIEILQCAIDCFNDYSNNIDGRHTVESETRFGNSVLALIETSKNYTNSLSLKQRIDENVKNITDWVNDTESRISILPVQSEMNYLVDRLNRFQNKPSYQTMYDRTNLPDSIKNLVSKYTVGEIESFWIDCKPHLATIQATLGKYNELVLNINSSIISLVMGTLVDCVNSKQNLERMGSMLGYNLATDRLFNNDGSLESIQKRALVVLSAASQYAVHSVVSERLTTNVSTLKSNLYSHQSDYRPSYSQRTSSASSSSSGCLVGVILFCIFMIILSQSINVF